MSSIKNKTISAYRRTKASLSFLSFFKKKAQKQEDLDKKLVYSLSTRKIPNGEQIRHLHRFLNPREFLIVKVCVFLILISGSYLLYRFVSNHLEYSPLSGGKYIEGVVGYPQTINPLYATNHNVDDDLARLIYSSLFKYDNNGRLVTDLAESYEVSENGLEYTVNLKPGVRWHDDSLLSADDVVFTFEAIKNSDYRSSLRPSLSLASIEKIDDNKVKFVLSETFSPFLESLTFGILPKNLWMNISPSAANVSDLNIKPIGSGPYKFSSLSKNKDGEIKDYSLVYNEDYYAKVPFIEEIQFKFFPSYEEAVKALNDNKIDGLSFLPFAYRPSLLAINSLQVHELSQSRLVSVFFNQEKNKALVSKETRVALSQAIDKDALLQEIFAGAYKRADGPITSNNPAYNPAISRYDFDPMAASSYFREHPLNLTLSVVDAGNNIAVAEKIKAYWELAGVQVSLNVIGSDQAQEAVRLRNFEAMIYGQSVGSDPDVFAFWHSSQIGGQGFNLAAYNNQEADKILSEARTEKDETVRFEKYRKFQELLTQDVPVIFLYSPSYTYIHSNNLKGFGVETVVDPADRFNSVSDWYLKTKKKIKW